ncbi:MAG: FMN-binding protein [Paludibacter sp.]|nr:FMN-binding protein [Paludibacter sp.]
MSKKLLFIALLLSLTMFGQGRRHERSVLHEVSNKDIVTAVYPNAVKVEKLNDFWYKIIDDKARILGFALSSMPYCKEVKGYNDVTPVMVITDKKWKIQKVSLMSNRESPDWVRKLENCGFFNSWNGKTVMSAKNPNIDARTGATCTALAVIRNVNFLLENGSKNLPQ